MRIEYLILIALWIIGSFGFILLIPGKDRRKGFLSFMTFQAFIWLCDMFAFKYGLLSAPVRELPKAHDFPLTIDYFFHPLLFSIFYVQKRAKGTIWLKLTYFLVWISAVTLFDVVIEQYTDLLEYGSITWYGMWFYIGFLYSVSLICCNLFYKDKSLFPLERWKTQ